jgi:hypothetical protein
VSQEKQIKVTDKRMFTPDGELREEYRFLTEKSTAAPAAPEAAPVAAPAPSPSAPAGSESRPETRSETRSDPRTAPPAAPAQDPFAEDFTDAGSPLGMPDAGYGPTFYDLVSMMAEPIPLYLGDVGLPNGQMVENLEMAGLHIDLLDVLRQKTAGNLTAQESAFLEDLLYRLRVRYVQKTR